MDACYRHAAVKRRLVECGEQFFATPIDLGSEGRDAEVVSVGYDWLGDIEGESALYFGEIVGESNPTSISQNSTVAATFSIAFRITVWGLPTPEAADEAAMRVLNAYAVPLRSLQRLIGAAAPDTAMDPVDGRSPFEATVTLGDIDGPMHSFPQSDGDDVAGAINGTFRCTTSSK